jgi:hypothetical protein
MELKERTGNTTILSPVPSATGSDPAMLIENDGGGVNRPT